MIKIGLYFGSFNPLTRAHYKIAEHSLKHLDEVWFVVSPANPDKEKTGELEDARHRFEMVERTVDFYNENKSVKNLFASDVEFFLPTPSWTDASIKKIKEELESLNGLKEDEYELRIICGRDTHHRVQSWKNKDYIIKNCSFLVYDRFGSDPVEDKSLHLKSFYVKDLGILPISSTLVREKIRKGGEIFDLVPDVVECFIREKKLYLNKSKKQ